MLIQLDWLKDYVEWGVSSEELAEVLSMGGLEVESLEQVALPGGKKTEVMEVNVTPNRGYCLSYRGVAREEAALPGQDQSRGDIKVIKFNLKVFRQFGLFVVAHLPARTS